MRRRITIMQPNGTLLYPDATRAQIAGDPHPELGAPAVIDVSDIPNADAAAPFEVTVEELCDHESWHVVGRVPLPNWADDAWRQRG